MVFCTGRERLLPRCTKLFGGTGNPVNIWGFLCKHRKNSRFYRSDFAVKVKKRSTRWAKIELSVLARPSACNIYLAAKLCYVMKVLQCIRKKVQVFHRIFALLIGNSGSEPMKRNSLFRSVFPGGLGLIHLYILRKHPRSCLYGTSRTLFHAKGSNKAGHIYSNFIVYSRDDASTHIFGYFKEEVHAFLFPNVRLSIDYFSVVTLKKLMSYMQDMHSPCRIIVR